MRVTVDLFQEKYQESFFAMPPGTWSREVEDSTIVAQTPSVGELPPGTLQLRGKVLAHHSRESRPSTLTGTHCKALQSSR